MFDIGWGELIVIGVVALIAIGPKELPGVLRMAGQWIGKVRRMASEFQGQFQEAMREAEMSDLKQQVDELNQSASGFASSFDPLETTRQEMQSALDGAGKDGTAVTTSDPGAVEPAIAAETPSPAPDFHVDLPEPPPAPTEADFAPTPADLGAVPAVPDTAVPAAKGGGQAA